MWGSVARTSGVAVKILKKKEFITWLDYYLFKIKYLFSFYILLINNNNNLLVRWVFL